MMANQVRHDRIIPLRDLMYYPGSDSADILVFLPFHRHGRRRVWVMTPCSTPYISLTDGPRFAPLAVGEGVPRWVDYGIVNIPMPGEPSWCYGSHYRVNVQGLPASECAESYLVITDRLELTLDGCTLGEAERRLWGLARADAGSTTLSPTRVPAGSPTRFVVRYTAGPRGLPSGALIRFTVARLFSTPQINDEAKPGFVSVGEADASVSIAEIARPLESHEKIDIICCLQTPLAPFAAFTLRYNTERMFVYPVLLDESDRRYWYSHLPPLAAAVAIDDASPFVSLDEEHSHTFEVIAGPSERLHLFLPGRRSPEENISLRGTFTDRFRNVPPSGVIDCDIELWLVSEKARTFLGTPAGAFVARHRFELLLPHLDVGVYRVFAYRRGSDVEVARSNPMEIFPAGSACERLYWGEIHGHSEQSDGSGEYRELYRHAREDGCLDFASGVDHAEYITDNRWRWMQDITNAMNEPGRFVTLVGYEWEGEQHDRNFYTSRSQLMLLRGDSPSGATLDDVWRHYGNSEDIVGGPHGLFVHGISAERWNQHNPAIERFAEVYSVWGQNDVRDGPLVPPYVRDGSLGAHVLDAMTANQILSSGAKLGFTGGGDCHEGHCGFATDVPGGQGTVPHTFSVFHLYRCGMTAALMPHLDRESLVSALRHRRTYATTGARILLDFSVSGLAMGAVGAAVAADCMVAVHAVQPLQRLEIVKDGTVVWSHDCNNLDANLTWHDPEPLSKEHYYYLHVIQSDGEMAWSSPVWVSPPA